MSRVVLATRSAAKRAEFAVLLAPLGIEVVSPDDLGLAETAAEANLEVFDSFEANARAKAEWFARVSGLPALADDSGLEVDALGGAPGVLSKRFAGVLGPDNQVTPANNRELLRRLATVPTPHRTARYQCALVWTSPVEHREIVARGTTSGRIIEAPRGSGGFGYDPLFLSDDLGKTFAEVSPVEKHAVSHRGRAVASLIAQLTD